MLVVDGDGDFHGVTVDHLFLWVKIQVFPDVGDTFCF